MQKQMATNHPKFQETTLQMGSILHTALDGKAGAGKEEAMANWSSPTFMRLCLQYMEHMVAVVPAVVPPKKDPNETGAFASEQQAPQNTGSSSGSSGQQQEERPPMQSPPPPLDPAQIAVGGSEGEEASQEDTGLDANMDQEGFVPSKKSKLAAAKAAGKQAAAAKAKAGALSG